jgi:hypothetical protein
LTTNNCTNFGICASAETSIFLFVRTIAIPQTFPDSKGVTMGLLYVIQCVCDLFLEKVILEMDYKLMLGYINLPLDNEFRVIALNPPIFFRIYIHLSLLRCLVILSGAG